jgi:hypothetical protein
MSVIRWLGLFVLNMLAFVLCPVLVLLALPFADPNDKVDCLPSWLWWLNTQDDQGRDQGLSEPQVVAKLRYGWYIKTWYWLGIRNQAYALFDSLAPHVTQPIVKGTAPLGRWLTLTQDGLFYWLYLNNYVDVGLGWKLFNADKPAFYFRFRPWKSPSN